MAKKITRAGVTKAEAASETRALNNSFKKRGIKREAYVTTVSESFNRKRTRKGFPVKKSYGIAVRNK